MCLVVFGGTKVEPGIRLVLGFNFNNLNYFLFHTKVKQHGNALNSFLFKYFASMPTAGTFTPGQNILN